jgi:cellulose synthase/poly-beta-1,6-N-acetylglucosamine synthase-like glycosyltransferase
MQILTKPNGGKASALNYGIEHTEAQFVVCIDADTKLHHDAVSLLMHHFLADPKGRVGGVAGNVKVGNQRNILTRWQAIEYTTSQNFDRQAYANINAITVVPGAIGAFRRQAILDAGGLTTDTLAEDCDLTIRVIKAGYIIENENAAVALTEAPEKLRQFMKQRTRWSFGVMQTFWKHRALLANSRYHGLGLWAFPNMFIFQFVIPTFSPIADLLMLAGLFSGNAGKIFLYYLIFTLVDCSVSLMAYLFEREKLSVLFWIIPQRFFYRWIMYVVLFRSYKKAIKGELQQWGVLKRTGNVKDI